MKNYPQERSVQMKTLVTQLSSVTAFSSNDLSHDIESKAYIHKFYDHFTIKETNLFNNSIHTFALWL